MCVWCVAMDREKWRKGHDEWANGCDGVGCMLFVCCIVVAKIKNILIRFAKDDKFVTNVTYPRRRPSWLKQPLAVCPPLHKRGGESWRLGGKDCKGYEEWWAEYLRLNEVEILFLWPFRAKKKIETESRTKETEVWRTTCPNLVVSC